MNTDQDKAIEPQNLWQKNSSPTRTRPNRKRSGQSSFTLVQWLVVLGLIVLIVGYFMVASLGPRATNNRVKCAANLMQIGNALMLYSNENRGRFPRTHAVDGLPVVTTNDGFADPNAFALPPTGNKINNIPQAMFLLIRQEDLTPAVFVCPSSSAIADAMGGQPFSNRSNFTGDGKPSGEVLKNVSYGFLNVYPTKTATSLGYLTYRGGFSQDFAIAADLSPAAIVDPLWMSIKLGAPRSTMILGNSNNHNQDGQNVLYADGHVQFQQTSLCGTGSDNIYTPQDTTAAGLAANASIGGTNPDPRSATDSVLMIHDK